MPEVNLRVRDPSGFYVYRGNQPLPEHQIRSPREIVGELHAKIAAKSPRHAKLVAAFEAIPRDDLGGPERQARLKEYAGLRASGMTKAAAGQELELARRTTDEYEADMRKMQETARA